MQLRLDIDIPQEIKNNLYQQLEALRKDYPVFQWVPKNEYRLELFRFGETYPADFLKRKIQEATFDSHSFTLFAHKLKISIQNTISLYVSFYENKELKQIVRNIKSQLSMNDTLTFYPDIIVARYKIPSKQQYLLIKKKCFDTDLDLEFHITQLTLYNSVNENNIITYQSESTYPLL